MEGAFVMALQIWNANGVVDSRWRRWGAGGGARELDLFKVDLEKACDHMDLNFLGFVMERKGFGEKWIESYESFFFMYLFCFIEVFGNLFLFLYVNGKAKGWVKAQKD